jgi:hypothetical protein
MPINIQKGTPDKLGKKSVRYQTEYGIFYVPIQSLIDAGYSETPKELFIIITDEEPEGYSDEKPDITTFDL